MPAQAKLTPEILAAAAKKRGAGVSVATIAKWVAKNYRVRVTPQGLSKALAKVRVEPPTRRAKTAGPVADEPSTAATRKLATLGRAAARIRRHGSAAVQLRAIEAERQLVMTAAKIETDATLAKGEQFAGLAELLGSAFDEELSDHAWLAITLPRLAADARRAATLLPQGRAPPLEMRAAREAFAELLRALEAVPLVADQRTTGAEEKSNDDGAAAPTNGW